MKSSVNEIRRRLLTLLLRVFFSVILLLFIFFFAFTGYFLAYQPDIAHIRFPFVSALEGYYAGSGSWEGVAEIVAAEQFNAIEKSILLDEAGRIVLDFGSDSTSRIGAPYEPNPHDAVFALRLHGRQIGTFIVTDMPAARRFGFAAGILTPVGVISAFLALFLVLIAALLVRRYVNPLADVIYAARAVADGKLDTRISTAGPKDLHSLAESFNEMAAALQRNDRERRDMLADIAHELRTPLSVIRGRLEGIVDGVYAENGAPVSTALQQTYLMQRLVEDLRLLTLAESRQLSFELKPVDLANVSRHVIELFQAEAREKNIRLSLNVLTERPVARADAQRAEQVVANLVSNALRYVSANGKIWIEISAIENFISLSVNDNGAGIPAADLPYVFDRFWRKDKSRNRETGGTGLGLAIVRAIIESQGGKAHVFSDGVGKGSAFVIYLPKV